MVKLEHAQLVQIEVVVELQLQHRALGILMDAHMKVNRLLLEHHGIMEDAHFLDNRSIWGNRGTIAVALQTVNKFF